jgi:TonB family protein
VFGVAEASILMPAWALELDERLRRLMLLHEEEHARAGDPQLVVAGLLVLVAMPWNLALWWQLRRLRMAVEVDCDARVLRREPDRRRYGTLLLEVGRRRGGNSLVVAFAEPRAFLERRLRRILTRSGRSLRRSSVLGLIALTLFVAAFYARDPVAASEVPEPGPTSEAAPPDTTSARPVFTPYTVRPELSNTDAVADALNRNYPALLRDAGIGGTAVVWFFIDEQGRVEKTSLHRSSGYTALDDAAERVASEMAFRPAYNRDRAVSVWVQIPITFQSARGAGVAEREAEGAGTAASSGAQPVLPLVQLAPESGEAAPSRAPLPARIEIPAPSLSIPRFDLGRFVPSLDPPRLRTRAIADGPTHTPYTLEPELINTAQIARALQRTYPPLLRDAGIGGTALLWFLIDERGTVQRKQIFKPSGHGALDDAALAIAEQMRFRPAENRGTRVPVWVQIPITFSSR